MKNHIKYDIFCNYQSKRDFEEYGMYITNQKNYRYHEIEVNVNICNNYKCENNVKCYIKNDYAYCKCLEKNMVLVVNYHLKKVR